MSRMRGVTSGKRGRGGGGGGATIGWSDAGVAGVGGWRSVLGVVVVEVVVCFLFLFPTPNQLRRVRKKIMKNHQKRKARVEAPDKFSGRPSEEVWRGSARWNAKALNFEVEGERVKGRQSS